MLEGRGGRKEGRKEAETEKKEFIFIIIITGTEEAHLPTSKKMGGK